MGNISNHFNNNTGRTDDPDPITGLTSREKYLVTSLWVYVKKDIVNNGVEILITYFTDHPEYQNYFPFKDMPLEELRTNKRFQAHAANVMYALSSMIDNLDNSELLQTILLKSGESHGKRGVPEAAYWDLKTTVMQVLQKGLGTKLTKEGIDAWNRTLDVAFKVIIRGLKN